MKMGGEKAEEKGGGKGRKEEKKEKRGKGNREHSIEIPSILATQRTRIEDEMSDVTLV